MKIDPNDPLLTAYALGELDETRQRQLEGVLAEAPEARQAVEEIRLTAESLARDFAAEPQPELTSAQRAAIATAATASGTPAVALAKSVRPGARRLPLARPSAGAEPVAVKFWERPGFWWGFATAACVALASLLLVPHRGGDGENDAGAMPLAQVVRQRDPVRSANSDASTARIEVAALASSNSQQSAMPATSTPEPVRELASSPPGTSQDFRMEPQVRRRYGLMPTPAPPAPPSRTAPTTPALPASSFAPKPTPPLARSDVPAPPTEGPALASRSVARPATSGPADSSSLASARSAFNGDDRVRTALLAQESARRQSSIDALKAPGRVAEAEVAERASLDPAPAPGGSGAAAYPRYVENPFRSVLDEPLSTFSLDVDTASYANVRRFLSAGQLPPRDAVRIEEWINYFPYDYPAPRGEHPFAVNLEVAPCPWNVAHRLLRVGLKARELAPANRPPSNFVFLLDVSGSMAPAERLPLLKQALRQLVRKMNDTDRVAVVIYADGSRLALSSTACREREKIFAAIDRLEASGSTNGGQGIQKAYAVAAEHFLRGGVNRVLLGTDGDFNVGLTDQTQLLRLIQEQARTGVFLTTLGVGTDNLNDALMQRLADAGNGNYHYLDTLEEAQKVLIEQMNGTLVTVAKDVKAQIEFNPAQVAKYRLIGYEKRALAHRDFHDDRKDAGEIGAGHTVTALYELVPGGATPAPETRGEPLKYPPTRTSASGGGSTIERVNHNNRALTPITQPARAGERLDDVVSSELLTLKLRYKKPEGSESYLLEFAAMDRGLGFGRASTDFRFAAAVAEFGMILQGSEYRGSATLEGVLETARGAKGTDAGGYRAEFINLVLRAKALIGRG